jgi:hypothetical protein
MICRLLVFFLVFSGFFDQITHMRGASSGESDYESFGLTAFDHN